MIIGSFIKENVPGKLLGVGPSESIWVDGESFVLGKGSNFLEMVVLVAVFPKLVGVDTTTLHLLDKHRS